MKIELRPLPPYNFPLSVRLFSTFGDIVDRYQGESYRRLLRIGDASVLATVHQDGNADNPTLHVSYARANHGEPDPAELTEVLEWQFNIDANIVPFYRLAAGHKTLGPIVRALYGLKPMRPPTVFEMVVIAITEQQLNLTVSIKIRNRVIEAFGDRLEREGQVYYAFPTSEALAAATIQELRACSLSGPKAGYITDVAKRVAAGELDLESLKTRTNEEVVDTITAIRGLGRWTAEYLLIRGLGRFDAVPADDLGVRDVVGRYLGSGVRVSAEEVRALLEPWGAHGGWVTFYLLAAGWLERAKTGPVG